MTNGCYYEGFKITCDDSSSPPKAFLSGTKLQVLIIDPTEQFTAHVDVPVFSSNCNNGDSSGEAVDLSDSPFSFSDTDNIFTAIGCDNHAMMLNHSNSIIDECLSTCTGPHPSKTGGGCYGLNCCQIPVPLNLKFLNASISSISSLTRKDCRSAFIVEQNWFQSNYLQDPSALKDKDHVPAVLKWGTRIGMCTIDRSSPVTPTCGSAGNMRDHRDRRCWTPLKEKNYFCVCKYESNPSRQAVCQGCSAGLGMLFLLIGALGLCKVIKRRKAIKLRQKFFKRNGGLLLQQQLSSNKGNIEKTKLFTSKELEMATDNYNANRILGQGGQGTVYKAMLSNGSIVAIKRSKIMDEKNLEHFINEVVILSQINHRNVVKLLGCCLETEVPLLIYEFVPNGTLFEYIHDQNEEFPLTWEMRLRIAIEVADALSYFHSTASIPIYHRDIKSANILLDDKYRAKISDFGISRSVGIDQTHLTTQVQGTFGYLDPEFFRSSQFTEKSDVYSFGVVLTELLTSQKPIRLIIPEDEEEKSLVVYFLNAIEENHLFDILDARIINESRKEEITAVAHDLAKRCLNLNGKKRPTMREVAVELLGIRSSNGTFILQQNYEEINSVDDDINEYYEVGTASSISLLNNGA